MSTKGPVGAQAVPEVMVASSMQNGSANSSRLGHLAVSGSLRVGRFGSTEIW